MPLGPPGRGQAIRNGWVRAGGAVAWWSAAAGHGQAEATAPRADIPGHLTRGALVNNKEGRA